MFDPNTWEIPETGRIYLDDKGELFATVDYEDYLWAIQWRWHANQSKSKHILYARRNTIMTKELGHNRSISLYLHVEIQRRKGIVQPPGHIIVDHRNGDSLNCRRNNLRYATPSMNRANINGCSGFDLIEEEQA